MTLVVLLYAAKLKLINFPRSGSNKAKAERIVTANRDLSFELFGCFCKLKT